MDRESSNRIKILKREDFAQYIARIEPNEMEQWFSDALAEGGEGLFAVTLGDTVIGVSYLEDESDAFLYVYIYPEYRNKGYGDLALAALEQTITAEPLDSISTSYRSDCEAAKRFAQKHGYKKHFASALMEYRGGRFPEEKLAVRRYRDEDYEEAFAMYAEAFHVMRLSTGCFPDSQPSRPSEREREYWAQHANDGYVFLSGDEIIGHARIDGTELSVVSIRITQQGKGYGRAFVKYLVNRILEKGENKPTLWCVVGNKKARSLYDSLGFAEIKRYDFADKTIGKP